MNEKEGKNAVIKTPSWVHLILWVLISVLVNPIAVQPLWLVPARRSLVSQNESSVFNESMFRWLVCVHSSLLIVKWWQTYQHGISGIRKQRLGIPANPCTHLWLGTRHFLCVYQLLGVPPSLQTVVPWYGSLASCLDGGNEAGALLSVEEGTFMDTSVLKVCLGSNALGITQHLCQMQTWNSEASN